MPKKRKQKDTRGPALFLRVDIETREWIAAKARADARSVTSMLRKILADAKAADALETPAPVAVAS